MQPLSAESFAASAGPVLLSSSGVDVGFVVDVGDVAVGSAPLDAEPCHRRSVLVRFHIVIPHESMDDFGSGVSPVEDVLNGIAGEAGPAGPWLELAAVALSS